MVTSWRRAFCTSIPKERETPVSTEQQQQQQCNNSSPRISSKLGFFSNSSTPRLQSQSLSSPSLRCRTSVATPPTSSLPNSPKLQCRTPTSTKSNSPRLLNFSNPSSPRSPSTFSLLKATLRFSKSRCGICCESVKSGQGTAIFTAECGHVFHFPCIAAHVKKQNLLMCPVCSANWKELPLLSIHQTPEITNKDDKSLPDVKTRNLRVYNDDESLMSPSPGSLFIPIPELEENDVVEDDSQEFQGFCVDPAPAKADDARRVVLNEKELEMKLLTESAVVAVGRSYETHVVVLKVRAPPAWRWARRAPVDLVAVVDVSEKMFGAKSQMVKRAMRLVISSLGSDDRLSIVAFSTNSKRLLPLRRMTAPGRRYARRVVEALGCVGEGMSVGDALKKAVKVIEDRRERNPVATIMILSDDRSHVSSVNPERSSSVVSSTRFSHLDIPVHSICFQGGSAFADATHEDAFAKCLSGLLNVVVQDLNLQLGFAHGSAEIAAVYSLSGRPSVFGPGSIRLGDFHAEEETKLLIELKVPTSSIGSHHVMSVRSSFRYPSSKEQTLSKEQSLLIPRAHAVRSSAPGIQRLRSLHISTRAVAESRRLLDHGDLSAVYHLLSSARALLLRSAEGTEYVAGLEAELAELQRRRQHLVVLQSQRQRTSQQAEKKPEPLTPTSAWRAAERLAKVAIMRKHMNRVSDLHGFENARF